MHPAASLRAVYCRWSRGRRQARHGGFRGSKLSLYEGGIRMPLSVRWPGRIAAGKVDGQTVLHAVDFFPSLCTLAGAKLPDRAALDGEALAWRRSLPGPP
jgi:arylsulfatase A-like enzyme